MNLLTSEEIEKAGRAESARVIKGLEGYAPDQEELEGLFESGAEFAQKAILEKCASGFEEYEFEAEAYAHMSYDERLRLWQSVRLSAEKEIAELKKRLEIAKHAMNYTLSELTGDLYDSNFDKSIDWIKQAINQLEYLGKK